MSTQPSHVSQRPEPAFPSDRPVRADTPETRRTRVITPVASEQFDEYVLIAKIGEGGMAQIFLALSQGPHGFRKLLVIKRLHAHLCSDPRRLERFSLEANLAASLHHPNIVQTNRVGVFRDQPFLTMEYLDGQPLSRVLYRLRSKSRRLPASLAVQIISQALDGLHYAHHATDYAGAPLGIVHRDISPHNLFVTYGGEVKLLDFGIAKANAAEAEADEHAVHGKSAYMAPEQARNEAADQRTDVWGMGVTLWECLVGRRLFHGETDLSVLRASLTDEIPSASEAAPHVPEPLARILERALQRNPERRFESALAFKEALDRWLVTERREDPRTALSSGMRALFADRIEERAQTLRSCMARLNVTPEADVVASLGSPRLPSQPPARPSIKPAPPTLEELRTEVVSQPATGSRQLTKAAVLVSALGLGALWALAPGPARLGVSGGPAAVASASNADFPRTELAPSVAAPQAPVAPVTAALPPVAAAPVPATSGPVAAVPAPVPVAPVPMVATAVPATSNERVVDPEPSRVDLYGGTRVRRPSTSEREPVEAVPEPAPAKPLREARAEPVPSLAAAAEPGTAARAMGRLKLDSTPYAIVSLNGKKLGITPIDVELPADTHTLVLRNPEQNLETSYRVNIVAGESVERRIALE
ncbi:MAG: protein kinase [Myxococcales bacterium]